METEVTKKQTDVMQSAIQNKSKMLFCLFFLKLFFFYFIKPVFLN